MVYYLRRTKWNSFFDKKIEFDPTKSMGENMCPTGRYLDLKIPGGNPSSKTILGESKRSGIHGV